MLGEAHGALVKVQLRPDHQGAILEYCDASSAGKAGLIFDGYEIEPGRKLRVGAVPELLREKPEFKTDKIGGPRKKNAPLEPAMPIRRPNQPGARRGGRVSHLRVPLCFHFLACASHETFLASQRLPESGMLTIDCLGRFGFQERRHCWIESQ